LAAVATINAEVLVGRQNYGIRKCFGHANEASIGEAHGNVGVFLDQLRDWLHVLGKDEVHKQGTTPKECAEARSAAVSEKVIRFGQNCFAR
jgi:hypothetical protein